MTVTLTYDPLGRLFEVVKKTGTTTNLSNVLVPEAAVER